MEDRDREIEIDLRELLYRICTRWRVLIIWMIVFSVVFGVLSYWLEKKKVSKMEISIEEQQKSVDLLSSAIEIAENEISVSGFASEAQWETLAEKKMEWAEQKAELEAEQIKLNDYISKKAEAEQSAVSKIQLKWIAIGLFLGLLCGGLWYYTIIPFKSGLLSPEDTEEYFGWQLLGTFLNDKKRKGLDKAIDRLFGKKIGEGDPNENCRLIASRIALTAKVENIDSVVFSDSLMSDASKKLTDKIAAELQKAGITTRYGRTVLQDGELLECLSENKSLVAVYGVNVTTYDEIRKEKALCLRNEIKMIGCIVAE